MRGQRKDKKRRKEENEKTRKGKTPYILGLEELGNGEEDLSCLRGGDHLALVNEVQDLGQDTHTLLGLDLALMKDPGLLEDRALVDPSELVRV